MDRQYYKLVGLFAAGTFGGVMLATAPDSNKPTHYYPRCADARAAGVAPIHRGEPGYRRALDRDGDGIACEPLPQS